MSRWHTPAARTRTSTCPPSSDGDGSSRSRSSPCGPGASITIARMPPRNTESRIGGSVRSRSAQFDARAEPPLEQRARLVGDRVPGELQSLPRVLRAGERAGAGVVDLVVGEIERVEPG